VGSGLAGRVRPNLVALAPDPRPCRPRFGSSSARASAGVRANTATSAVQAKCVNLRIGHAEGPIAAVDHNYVRERSMSAFPKSDIKSQ
jgi:hypothetical protein